MGRQARAAAAAGLGTELTMEKATIHQHLSDGPFLLRCYADDGALLQSIASLLAQSSKGITERANNLNSWQNVQKLSALQASIRFLPSMIFAAILNILTGLVVHRVPAIYLVVISSIFGAIAPLLMAVIDAHWPYWYAAFPAQLLEPLSPDGESSYDTLGESTGQFQWLTTLTSALHCRHSSSLGGIPGSDASTCRRSIQYSCSIWSGDWTGSYRCCVGFCDARLKVC